MIAPSAKPKLCSCSPGLSVLKCDRTFLKDACCWSLLSSLKKRRKVSMSVDLPALVSPKKAITTSALPSCSRSAMHLRLLALCASKSTHLFANHCPKTLRSSRSLNASVALCKSSLAQSSCAFTPLANICEPQSAESWIISLIKTYAPYPSNPKSKQQSKARCR